MTVDSIQQLPEVDRTVVQRLPIAAEQPVMAPRTPPSLVPGEILLGTLFDPRLKVVLPMRVVLSLDHDHVVAEITELNEFGFGACASEAVDDIQRAIGQLYHSLEEESERLGPDLQRTWDLIQTFVVKTATTPDDQAR